MTITPLGRSQLDAWLRTPVRHLRDIRSELLLKLALLACFSESGQPLVNAQLQVLEPMVISLEKDAATSDSREFEGTLLSWRLELARAVVRFLTGLTDVAAISAGS